MDLLTKFHYFLNILERQEHVRYHILGTFGPRIVFGILDKQGIPNENQPCDLLSSWWLVVTINVVVVVVAVLVTVEKFQ